jgi:hypothetical protein
VMCGVRLHDAMRARGGAMGLAVMEGGTAGA